MDAKVESRKNEDKRELSWHKYDIHQKQKSNLPMELMIER
jgi:hypothetical protein